ncbi:carboxypeptidase-like regulatory domain-containing protein [Lusitaniella coriacea]|uniref:carboxypeptidase-like regulatory domain-containing protein n=1 Tax=Lusitaniella coriacea TaxID=1983105 RepID=UPI003CF2B01D
MTSPKLSYLLPLLLLSSFSGSREAFAHSSTIKYRQTQAIEIQANYEQNVPMVNAQVTIYAPNNPSTPWQQGITDEQGRYTFIPDRTQTGSWEVKVRQAGHGSILTIPVEETATATTVPTAQSFVGGSNEVYTPLQKTVMAMAGIWGCVGTALFFSRKKIDHC